LGRQTPEKLHSMLSNYLESYSASLHHLKAFLQKLVKEDKIDFTAGEYSKK